MLPGWILNPLNHTVAQDNDKHTLAATCKRVEDQAWLFLGFGGDERASSQESDCACALKNQAPELNEAAGCLKFLSAHSNAVFWYTICNQTCICRLLLCFWEPNPSHTAAKAITPTSSQNKYTIQQNVSHKPIIFRSHHPWEGWYEQQQKKCFLSSYQLFFPW